MKYKIIPAITLLGLLVCSTSAFAGGYLAKGVKVVKVSAMMRIGENYYNFGIKVEGGLPGYPCPAPAGNWIKFPAGGSSSPVWHAGFNRIYSTLLLAYAQGSRVNIYDYSDNVSCDHAMSVQIEP
jgi:hypothetical protein